MVLSVEFRRILGRCGAFCVGMIAPRAAPPAVRPALQAHPPPLRHSSVGPCRAVTAGYASGTSPCCPGQPCACTLGRGLYRGTSAGPGRDMRSLCAVVAHGRWLKRGRKSASTRLASSMVAASASRSSVTSLSWKVPAIRSTRPLAWGDRANISCTPSSSIARLNWVGAAAASDGGVYLNTACRSAYSAVGMPQLRIRPHISRK